MEAISKHSGLNPLAMCFVPSNFKQNGEDTLEKPTASNKCEGKTKNKAPNVKHITDVVEVKRAKYRKEKKNKLYIFLTYPLSDIFNYKNMFCKRSNETVYFAKDITKMEIIKPNGISLPKFDIAFYLKLLLMILFKFYPRQNSLTYNVNNHDGKSDALDDSTSDEECCCPPMFGCTVPPEFFGNPFKLNPSCNKKCVHVCHYPNVDRNIEPHKRKNMKSKDPFDAKEWTKLDKYTHELEKIVKDVCAFVNLATCEAMDHKERPDSDSCINSKWSSFEKADFDNEIKVVCEETREESHFFTKANKIPSSKQDQSNLDNLSIEMGIPVDTPTIEDDDFHPLLDEGISMMDNDGEVSPVIKKMIEIGFSPTRKEERLSFDPEELPENICNPPCSVWCDSLPQPANDSCRKFKKTLPEQDSGFGLNGRIFDSRSATDTYEKSVKKLWERQRTSSNAENSEQPKFQFSRPLYKRSSSVNDCLEPTKYVAQISRSDDELMRKQILGNPSNYSKSCYLNQTLKDEKRTQSLNENSTLYMLNEEIYTKCNKSSNTRKWGLFDGEDSLWQPLPDCVSLNENLKQSSHKRVRELRRQISLN